MMNSLVFFAAQLFTANCSDSSNDICQTKAFGTNNYMGCRDYIMKEYNAFSIYQFKHIGKTSSVCAHLDSADFANLQKAEKLRDRALIEVLPFHCIKDILKASPQTFLQLYTDIEKKGKRDRVFIKKHAEEICKCKGLFKGTGLEHVIDLSCRSEELQTSLDRALTANGEKGAKIIELEYILSRPNDAPNHASASSLVAISAILAALTVL